MNVGLIFLSVQISLYNILNYINIEKVQKRNYYDTYVIVCINIIYMYIFLY